MHENLVRAFYSNAICVEVDDDGKAMFVDHITTFVMRKTLVVTKESIAWVLGIPDVDDCNKEQPYSDTIKTINNQAGYFSFEDRILHIFISHVLRPFGNKYFTI